MGRDEVGGGGLVFIFYFRIKSIGESKYLKR